MKFALISPNEKVENGYRVAQVELNTFEVANPLFWLECENDVKQDLFFYDPSEKLIKPIPVPPEPVTE